MSGAYPNMRPLVADILRVVTAHERAGCPCARDDIRRALSDPAGGMFARVMPYTRADVDAEIALLESIGLLMFTPARRKSGRA